MAKAPILAMAVGVAAAPVEAEPVPLAEDPVPEAADSPEDEAAVVLAAVVARVAPLTAAVALPIWLVSRSEPVLFSCETADMVATESVAEEPLEEAPVDAGSEALAVVDEPSGLTMLR